MFFSGIAILLSQCMLIEYFNINVLECAKQTQASSACVLAILLRRPDVSRQALQSKAMAAKPMLIFEANAEANI